jgi:hypothetical protein
MSVFLVDFHFTLIVLNSLQFDLYSLDCKYCSYYFLVNTIKKFKRLEESLNY